MVLNLTLTLKTADERLVLCYSLFGATKPFTYRVVLGAAPSEANTKLALPSTVSVSRNGNRISQYHASKIGVPFKQNAPQSTRDQFFPLPCQYFMRILTEFDLVHELECVA